MTGKERILTTLSGPRASASGPCLALMPITMMFAADTAGIRYRDYVTDHRLLVEAQLRTAETYDLDYVSVISDPAREAADLGAAVQFFDDQPPAILESQALLADKDRLRHLKLPDPTAPGRMSDRLEGVALLAARAGRDKMIEGWVEGPCAMAADLRGVNTLMLDFYDDAAFVEDLFDFVIAMEIAFAREQIRAGAELIGIGDAAASLIGPRVYEQFVFEREKQLVHEIRAMGARVRLHICGNTRKILRGMGHTGADIVDLDFLASLAEGRAAMGPDQVLLGNIDPVRVLRDGTPDSIEAAIAECHQQAGEHYIAGAGCEVPRGTPPENLLAMTRYAHCH